MDTTIAKSGILFRGIPLEELSKDDLIAALIVMMKREQDSNNTRERERSMRSKFKATL